MPSKKVKPSLLQTITITIGSTLLVLVGSIAIVTALQPKPVVNSFQTCKDAGGAIMESYPEQCAKDGTTYTNPDQAVGASAEEYIGLSEGEALAKAQASGKVARVVERDGEALPVTMDFMQGRLNLQVKDGSVYMVQIEGEDE